MQAMLGGGGGCLAVVVKCFFAVLFACEVCLKSFDVFVCSYTDVEKDATQRFAPLASPESVCRGYDIYFHVDCKTCLTLSHAQCARAHTHTHTFTSIPIYISPALALR